MFLLQINRSGNRESEGIAKQHSLAYRLFAAVTVMLGGCYATGVGGMLV